jgi:hypothetical protein
MRFAIASVFIFIASSPWAQAENAKQHPTVADMNKCSLYRAESSDGDAADKTVSCMKNLGFSFSESKECPKGAWKLECYARDPA